MNKVVCMIVLILSLSFVILFMFRKNRYSEIKIIKSDMEAIYIDRKKIKSLLKPEHQLYGVFNPSIFYRTERNDYLALFRVSSFASCPETLYYKGPYHSVIYKASISYNGDVSQVELVDLPYEDMIYCNDIKGIQPNNGIEDPRLFIYKNEFWGVGNANGFKNGDKCTPQMVLWKLEDSRNTFVIIKTPWKSKKYTSEKNWTPFTWNDKLFFEYSVNPRLIIEVYPKTGISGIVSKSTIDVGKFSGGGSAILIEYNNKSYYLNVGHKWILAGKNWKTKTNSFLGGPREYNRDYYHYFYLFEAHPPFNIVKITNMIKLNKNNLVQFAAGITQVKNGKIAISYGEDDCNSVISFYNMKKIIDDMKDAVEL